MRGLPNALTRNHSLGTHLGWNKDTPSHPLRLPSPQPLHLPFPPATLTTQKHSHSTLELLRNRILRITHQLYLSTCQEYHRGGGKSRLHLTAAASTPFTEGPNFANGLDKLTRNKKPGKCGSARLECRPCHQVPLWPRVGMYLPISSLVDQENPHLYAKRMFCHRKPRLGNGEKKCPCMT